MNDAAHTLLEVCEQGLDVRSKSLLGILSSITESLFPRDIATGRSFIIDLTILVRPGFNHGETSLLKEGDRMGGRKKMLPHKQSGRIMNGYLVEGESGLATHVLEQQLGDLEMLPTTGMVQQRVARLSVPIEQI